MNDINFLQDKCIQACIGKAKNEFAFKKAEMKGFRNDLLRIKTKLEEIYGDIFRLGYSLDDAPYHGWGGECLQDMRKIDKEIHKRFLEIYAIVLCGLGE